MIFAFLSGLSLGVFLILLVISYLFRPPGVTSADPAFRVAPFFPG